MNASDMRNWNENKNSHKQGIENGIIKLSFKPKGVKDESLRFTGRIKGKHE